jgi:ribosome-binding protein aMBF1 (putative translation factor)
MKTQKKPTFDDLMKDIEAEAHAEGAEAVAQLERLRHRYARGAQLVALRLQCGMTQKDLEAKTGIKQSEISKIENGVGNPTEDTLATLGHALGAKLVFVPAQDYATA